MGQFAVPGWVEIQGGSAGCQNERRTEGSVRSRSSRGHDGHNGSTNASSSTVRNVGKGSRLNNPPTLPTSHEVQEPEDEPQDIDDEFMQGLDNELTVGDQAKEV